MLRKAATVLGLVLAAAPALADEVTLETGEVLKGKVLERTEVEVVLDHPVLGKLTIPGAKVKGVLLDEEKAKREAEEAAKKEAEAEAKRKKAEEPPAWESHLEVGLNGSEGNSDTLNVHAGVEAKREWPGHAWKLDAKFTKSETDGVETSNRFTSGARKDWTFEDSPWFHFAEARYDRDRFTEWDQRGSLAAGAGYRWIDREDLKVGLRLGAAATKEWGSADDDHVRPEALLGGEAEWAVTDGQSLTASTTWYPDLADRYEYRIVSSAAWKLRLNEAGSLNLKFGVEHELDTHRGPPFQRQDLRYFGVLMLDF